MGPTEPLLRIKAVRGIRVRSVCGARSSKRGLTVLDEAAEGMYRSFLKMHKKSGKLRWPRLQG